MPQSTTTVPAVMSLSDIAGLTRVQRAVVSAWRRRPLVRGEHVPFPEPVGGRDGQERFGMADVVEWLDRTGRGNNPDFRADALAHAQPSVRLDDSVAAAALDSLLCLKARTGLDLGQSPRQIILGEADEVDPEDDHLVSELVAAGDDLTAIAVYAERLTDAAWDAASAHRLARRRGPGRGSLASLAPVALELIGRMGAAMALDLESDIVVVDPGQSDPDLVDAVMTELGEGVAAQVLVVGTSIRARAARRLHWVRGRDVVSVAPHGTRPIVVTRVPVSAGDRDPAAVLSAVDDLQLDLSQAQRALVVGPAVALCDRLADDSHEQQRDHVIRLGRLRSALRLPPGLVTDGSRQVVGLWVLGGAPGSRRVDEQRLATADLTNEVLRSDVIEDVVTDVVASMTDRARATHAFRHARLTATSTLLADSGPLVAAGSRPSRRGEEAAAASIVRVRARAAGLDDHGTAPPVLGRLSIAPGEGAGAPHEVTIDAAIRAGDVRVLPGTRITGTAPEDRGRVRIVDAAAVHDPWAHRRGLDPLELESSWPRARRTEAGDVIFCVSPRPAAVVDDEGLSVVAAPARVLRCTPGSGLVPEAVARAINDLPERSPRWRAWPVPQVPAEQAEVLRTALRHLAREEDRARRRLAGLTALAGELTHGVARGAMTLSPSPTEKGH